MMKINKFVLGLVILILLAQLAIAGTVTRSFSPVTPTPNNIVTVDLVVCNIGAATFYTVDEKYPNGWTVVNAGAGATDQPGHLKWFVTQGAAETSYTYIIQAPANINFGEMFLGNFMFEGDTEEITIDGLKQFSVGSDDDDDPLCTEDDWDYEATWSVCSVPCGDGTQTKAAKKRVGVTCEGEGGKPAPLTQACNEEACDLCANQPACPLITVACPDGFIASCTPICNPLTGCGGDCELDCSEHMVEGDDIEPAEQPALTLLKARISSVLDENYEAESGISNDDLIGYGYSGNNFVRVSKIANALKDYFATS